MAPNADPVLEALFELAPKLKLGVEVPNDDWAPEFVAPNWKVDDAVFVVVAAVDEPNPVEAAVVEVCPNAGAVLWPKLKLPPLDPKTELLAAAVLAG